VDPSGALTDGRPFSGPNDLNALLISDPARLARAFIAHLSRYATGAEVSYADRAQIRQIVESTNSNGYGMRSLIHALAADRNFIGKRMGAKE
jgi:site-specific recombinase XerC